MKPQELAYKKVGNNEAYTPDYGVKPILQYIHKEWVVWCPFDKEESEFVKLISQTNKVIYSHIEYGHDFFFYEPKEHWDCIISNPPYENKRKIFERALSFGKPFALLMTATWLNDSGSKMVYLEAQRQMQLLLLDKRIKFANPDGRANDKITFNTSYFCCDFLPTDLKIAELEIPKSKGKKK